ARADNPKPWRDAPQVSEIGGRGVWRVPNHAPMMGLIGLPGKPRGLVARSGRYRYILSRVRVQLHPALCPNPRQGSASRRWLAARGEVRRLPRTGPQGGLARDHLQPQWARLHRALSFYRAAAARAAG